MRLLERPATPYVYLSGGHTSGEKKYELEWIKRSGCRFRCASFSYIYPEAFFFHKRMAASLEISLKKNIGMMLDSGAHSFHSFQRGLEGKISKKKAGKKARHADADRLKEELFHQYVKFLKKRGDEFDFYITLDYVRECSVIFKMQERFEKHGLRPVPVYHGDQDTDWFLRYVDKGYKLICLGTVFRPRWKDKCYFYDTVFNLAEKHGILLHGLAITGLGLMFKYPWYSVDSSTWVKVAAYGKIIFVDTVRHVINQIHVSDHASNFEGSLHLMPPNVKRAFREQVEKYGFDLDKLKNDLRERTVWNALMFEKVIPKLKTIQVEEANKQWPEIIS